MLSPFLAREDGEKSFGINVSEPELIVKVVKPVIVYPEKDNKDVFYVSYEEVITQKLDRKKYIKSFDGDVGVLNVVKKLALNKENAMDGRFAVKSNTYVDMRDFPKDGEEMAKMLANKNEVWAKLDPELKKDLTYEEFCNTFTLDEFNAYIKSKIVASKTSTPVVDETKKEG